MSNIIELKNVNKWFDKFQVLKDINLTVNQKEKIVVCGPSGSGKSTLIRCINRLEEHQEGNIVVDGNEISENTKDIEKIRAEVGMVFQQFNLFPHLSILDNCTLAPIWVKKLPKKQAEEIAMSNLKRVQIDDQALKFPGQLSGGQQQRAAWIPWLQQVQPHQRRDVQRCIDEISCFSLFGAVPARSICRTPIDYKAKTILETLWFHLIHGTLNY